MRSLSHAGLWQLTMRGHDAPVPRHARAIVGPLMRPLSLVVRAIGSVPPDMYLDRLELRVNADPELAEVQEQAEEANASNPDIGFFADVKLAVNLPRLRKFLDAGGAQVLHFAGHGLTSVVVPELNSGVMVVPLLLTTRTASASYDIQVYDADALLREIHARVGETQNPFLFVMMGCETADFCRELVAALPWAWAIGWHTKLLDSACASFTRHFYRRLFGDVARSLLETGAVRSDVMWSAYNLTLAAMRTDFFSLTDPDFRPPAAPAAAGAPGAPAFAPAAPRAAGIPILFAGAVADASEFLPGYDPVTVRRRLAEAAAATAAAGGGHATGAATAAPPPQPPPPPPHIAPPPATGAGCRPDGSSDASPSSPAAFRAPPAPWGLPAPLVGRHTESTVASQPATVGSVGGAAAAPAGGGADAPPGAAGVPHPSPSVASSGGRVAAGGGWPFAASSEGPGLGFGGESEGEWAAAARPISAAPAVASPAAAALPAPYRTAATTADACGPVFRGSGGRSVFVSAFEAPPPGMVMAPVPPLVIARRGPSLRADAAAATAAASRPSAAAPAAPGGGVLRAPLTGGGAAYAADGGASDGAVAEALRASAEQQATRAAGRAGAGGEATDVAAAAATHHRVGCGSHTLHDVLGQLLSGGGGGGTRSAPAAPLTAAAEADAAAAGAAVGDDPSTAFASAGTAGGRGGGNVGVGGVGGGGGGGVFRGAAPRSPPMAGRVVLDSVDDLEALLSQKLGLALARSAQDAQRRLLERGSGAGDGGSDSGGAGIAAPSAASPPAAAAAAAAAAATARRQRLAALEAEYADLELAAVAAVGAGDDGAMRAAAARMDGIRAEVRAVQRQGQAAANGAPPRDSGGAAAAADGAAPRLGAGAGQSPPPPPASPPFPAGRPVYGDAGSSFESKAVVRVSAADVASVVSATQRALGIDDDQKCCRDCGAVNHIIMPHCAECGVVFAMS